MAALASGKLQGIADGMAGDRARLAAAGAVVLRAVEEAVTGGAATEFLVRRAAAEAGAVRGQGEGKALEALVCGLGAPQPARLAPAVVRYAGVLEDSSRCDEADAALELARTLAPRDAEVALHAARLARKLGQRERALELYREARRLDGVTGSIGRLARVGEALVSEAPEREIGGVLRSALAAGDGEAAAVTLEERAALRRARGDVRGAVRDLAIAALRYTDRSDRARVAHVMADICVAAGDSLGAREALLVALQVGDAGQREHARARLHGLSRDLSDRLGMRRWRSSRKPALVSFGLYRARSAGRSMAPALLRWRARFDASV
jgi:tetratricopeptide (TPR) repeat protein